MMMMIIITIKMNNEKKSSLSVPSHSNIIEIIIRTIEMARRSK